MGWRAWWSSTRRANPNPNPDPNPTPNQERLLHDWACEWRQRGAGPKELGVKGRLYLFTSHLCFGGERASSNYRRLQGKRPRLTLTLPLEQLASIERHAGGCYPNPNASPDPNPNQVEGLMRRGELVPSETVVALLRRRMRTYPGRRYPGP